jgi:hypothetical protein
MIFGFLRFCFLYFSLISEGVASAYSDFLPALSVFSSREPGYICLPKNQISPPEIHQLLWNAVVVFRSRTSDYPETSPVLFQSLRHLPL